MPKKKHIIIYFRIEGSQENYNLDFMAEDAAHALEELLRLDFEREPDLTVNISGRGDSTHTVVAYELLLGTTHEGMSARDYTPRELKGLTILNAAALLKEAEFNHYHGVQQEPPSAKFTELFDLDAVATTQKETSHGLPEKKQTEKSARSRSSAPEPVGKTRDEAAEPDAQNTGDVSARERADDIRGDSESADGAVLGEDVEVGDVKTWVIKVGMDVRIWGDVEVEAATLEEAQVLVTHGYVAEHIQTEAGVGSDDLDASNGRNLSLLHAHDYDDPAMVFHDIEVDVPDHPDTLPHGDGSGAEAHENPPTLDDLPSYVPTHIYELVVAGTTTVFFEAPVGMDKAGLLDIPGMVEHLRWVAGNNAQISLNE